MMHQDSVTSTVLTVSRHRTDPEEALDRAVQAPSGVVAAVLAAGLAIELAEFCRLPSSPLSPRVRRVAVDGIADRGSLRARATRVGVLGRLGQRRHLRGGCSGGGVRGQRGGVLSSKLSVHGLVRRDRRSVLPQDVGCDERRQLSSVGVPPPAAESRRKTPPRMQPPTRWLSRRPPAAAPTWCSATRCSAEPPRPLRSTTGPVQSRPVSCEITDS